MSLITQPDSFHGIADVLAHYNDTGECTVKTWAAAGRVSTRAVYDYMHGLSRPDVDTFANWIQSRHLPTQAKLHLATVIFAGSGLEVRLRSPRQTRIAFAADVETEVIDVTGAGQALLQVAHAAIADKRIDSAEATRICAAAARVQAEAAEVAGIVGIGATN